MSSDPYQFGSSISNLYPRPHPLDTVGHDDIQFQQTHTESNHVTKTLGLESVGESLFSSDNMMLFFSLYVMSSLPFNVNCSVSLSTRAVNYEGGWRYLTTQTHTTCTCMYVCMYKVAKKEKKLGHKN